MGKRKIAVVGSTGGNLFSQGGRAVRILLDRIESEGLSWDCEISRIVFLCADQSLDNVRDQAPAYLLSRGFESGIGKSTGNLVEVNVAVRNLSNRLADELRRGEIDALVSISADPVGVNREVFEAAKVKRIPIVASGASSVAWIKAMGCHVVYSTGTTGTTADLRAINYMAALSRFWQNKPGTAVTGRLSKALKQMSFGFESWCLPYFLVIVILKSLTDYGINAVVPVYDGLTRFSALIACVAVSRSHLRAPGIGMAVVMSLGIIASVTGSGFIGGTVAGLAGAILLNVVVYTLAGRKMPGSAMSLLVYLLAVVPLCAALLSAGKYLFQLNQIIIWAVLALYGSKLFWIGFVVGAAFWPLIEIGLYHRLILPLILLEIGTRGASVMGAFDLVCLVAPAVGAGLAALLLARDRVSECLHVLGETILYGTNVEYVYTFTGKSWGAKICLWILCGAAGLCICRFKLSGVGYLPVFLVPLLVQNGKLLAVLIAAVSVSTGVYFSILSYVKKKLEL